MTADSENTIDKFEDDKIYIIGGIVDHNRHKNVWFNKATEQGIAHAKFPIKENVNIGDYSTVLTVNQVIGKQILILWHAIDIILAVRKYQAHKDNGEDSKRVVGHISIVNPWELALKETLPLRKKEKVVGQKARKNEKHAKPDQVDLNTEDISVLMKLSN